jgi:hypothetical protein
MEPEKNLHAKIPPALLTEAENLAEAEHITVDAFVQDAMEHRLRERRRQKLYAYGDMQARKLGIREEDVERIIHEYRQEEGARPSNERGH